MSVLYKNVCLCKSRNSKNRKIMLIFKLHDYTTHFYIISDAILSGTNTSRDISIVMNNCKKNMSITQKHILVILISKKSITGPRTAELFVLQIVAHSDIRRATVFRLLSNLVKVIAKNVSNNMGAILKFSKIALQFLCAFHIFKLES